MNTTNFDKFNQITLYTLVQLFDQFPLAIDIDADKNALDAFSHIQECTEDEAWDLMNLGFQTLTWLESEGFISITQKTYGGKCVGVRLTLKGLTVLGYSVGNQDKSETLIDKAKEALEDTAIESAKDVMKKLFTAGIGLASGVIG